jgi:uncharacterized protein (TIGR03067 family)
MKSIRLAIAAALTALIIPVLWGAESESVKKDMALLQGEWSMVSGSADGRQMPEETRKQMKRVCKGDEATTTMGGQMFMKAKITIDPSKEPKAIDYDMTEGFTKGQKQLGIYEVTGDTFKSCFAKPGAERPTDFTGKPGDGRTLSIWKREKPAAISEPKPNQ